MSVSNQNQLSNFNILPKNNYNKASAEASRVNKKSTKTSSVPSVPPLPSVVQLPFGNLNSDKYSLPKSVDLDPAHALGDSSKERVANIQSGISDAKLVVTPEFIQLIVDHVAQKKLKKNLEKISNTPEKLPELLNSLSKTAKRAFEKALKAAVENDFDKVSVSLIQNVSEVSQASSQETSRSSANVLVGLMTAMAIGLMAGGVSLGVSLGLMAMLLLAQSKLSQQMIVGLLLTESLLKGVGVDGRVTTLGFSDQSCDAYSLDITGAKYIVDGKESDAVSKLLNSTQVTGDFKEAIRSGCQNLEAILKFMAENIETTLVNPQSVKTPLVQIQSILPDVLAVSEYGISKDCQSPLSEVSEEAFKKLISYFSKEDFSAFELTSEFLVLQRFIFNEDGTAKTDVQKVEWLNQFFNYLEKKLVLDSRAFSLEDFYVDSIVYAESGLYCAPAASDNDVICPVPIDTSKTQAAAEFFEKIKALFYLFDPNSSEKDCLKMKFLVGRSNNDINKDSEARLERVTGEVGQNILTIKKAINLLNTTGTIIDKDKKTKDAYALNEVASDLLNCVVDLLFKPNSKKELDLYEKLESSMYELNNIVTQWKTKETKAKSSADNFEQILNVPGAPTLTKDDETYKQYLHLKGNSTSAEYYNAVDFFTNKQFDASQFIRANEISTKVAATIAGREYLQNSNLLVADDKDRLQVIQRYSNKPSFGYGFDAYEADMKLITDPQNQGFNDKLVTEINRIVDNKNTAIALKNKLKTVGVESFTNTTEINRLKKQIVDNSVKFDLDLLVSATTEEALARCARECNFSEIEKAINAQSKANDSIINMYRTLQKSAAEYEIVQNQEMPSHPELTLSEAYVNTYLQRVFGNQAPQYEQAMSMFLGLKTDQEFIAFSEYSFSTKVYDSLSEIIQEIKKSFDIAVSARVALNKIYTPIDIVYLMSNSTNSSLTLAPEVVLAAANSLLGADGTPSVPEAFEVLTMVEQGNLIEWNSDYNSAYTLAKVNNLNTTQSKEIEKNKEFSNTLSHQITTLGQGLNVTNSKVNTLNETQQTQYEEQSKTNEDNKEFSNTLSHQITTLGQGLNVTNSKVDNLNATAIQLSDEVTTLGRSLNVTNSKVDTLNETQQTQYEEQSKTNEDNKGSFNNLGIRVSTTETGLVTTNQHLVTTNQQIDKTQKELNFVSQKAEILPQLQIAQSNGKEFPSLVDVNSEDYRHMAVKAGKTYGGLAQDILIVAEDILLSQNLTSLVPNLFAVNATTLINDEVKDQKNIKGVREAVDASFPYSQFPDTSIFLNYPDLSFLKNTIDASRRFEGSNQTQADYPIILDTTSASIFAAKEQFNIIQTLSSYNIISEQQRYLDQVTGHMLGTVVEEQYSRRLSNLDVPLSTGKDPIELAKSLHDTVTSSGVTTVNFLLGTALGIGMVGILVLLALQSFVEKRIKDVQEAADALKNIKEKKDVFARKIEKKEFFLSEAIKDKNDNDKVRFGKKTVTVKDVRDEILPKLDLCKQIMDKIVNSLCLIEYRTEVSFFIPKLLYDMINAGWSWRLNRHTQSVTPMGVGTDSVKIVRISINTKSLFVDGTVANDLSDEITKNLHDYLMNSTLAQLVDIDQDVNKLINELKTDNYNGRRLALEQYDGVYVRNFNPDKTVLRRIEQTSRFVWACVTHRGPILQLVPNGVVFAYNYLTHCLNRDKTDFELAPSYEETLGVERSNNPKLGKFKTNGTGSAGKYQHDYSDDEKDDDNTSPGRLNRDFNQNNALAGRSVQTGNRHPLPTGPRQPMNNPVDGDKKNDEGLNPPQDPSQPPLSKANQQVSMRNIDVVLLGGNNEEKKPDGKKNDSQKLVTSKLEGLNL